MSRIENLPDGSRRVTLWKRDGVDMDRYPKADNGSADSHKNSTERTNAMSVVELEKKAARHEARFGPLGAAKAPSASGLPAALAKAEEIKKSETGISAAEAFRQALRDPAIRDAYERECGGAQDVTPTAVGLAKAERVAEELRKDDPALTSAESFRRAMRTPEVKARYAEETGYVGPEAVAKAEEARALDGAAVEARAAELQAQGLPWRAAWSQAIKESGHGAGAAA
jgi:hypothetical protein